MWRWSPSLHDQFVGRNRLSARRTRSRVSEQPAGTIRSIGSIKFLFSCCICILWERYVGTEGFAEICNGLAVAVGYGDEVGGCGA